MFQDMSGMKEDNKHRQKDWSYKADYYLNYFFFYLGMKKLIVRVISSFRLKK